MSKSKLFKFIYIFLILLSLSSCKNKYEFSTKDGFIYNQQGHILGYEGNADIVTIPEKIGDINILSINLSAINSDKLYIPSTIKMIECLYTGFYDIYYDGTIKQWCDNVKILSSKTNLLNSAKMFYFKNDSNEYYSIGNKLEIPEGVTRINSHQLALPIDEVVIPKSITYIDSSALGELKYQIPFKKVYYNGSISDWCKIDLINAHRSLCTEEFYVLNGNKYELVDKLLLSKEIDYVGAYQFNHLRYIEEIIIESGVKFIHPNAFEGCYNVNKVTMPKYLMGLNKYITNSNDEVEFTYVD